MASDLHAKSNQSVFYNLLGNTLATSITNFTIWFALTYFVYLQTRSVFATAVIAGLFLLITAGSGVWFGSIVDHHKKKAAMLFSSIASLVLYSICFTIYLAAGDAAFKDVSSPTLWIFATLLMLGVVIGNIRTIALPTIVTMLIAGDRRDKANGLVGATSGVSVLITSVISGLLVGFSGMLHVFMLAIAITVIAILHLLAIHVPEQKAHADGTPKKADIKGTIKVISNVPGLFALIIFATFNNFLGGVFMALMDPYGLSLVTVQTWGILWGFLSSGFIIGGLLVAKKGLGKSPLRTLFISNIIIWSISCVFAAHASIILLSVGLFIYVCLVPFAEAAEQTILQKVVPFERQGRVFGFAQSVEQAAAPLTAFLIGPIAQLVFIPFMAEGGAGANLIGSWFGVGPDRGIALVFTVTGVIGLLSTIGAMRTKYYRLLSERQNQAETVPITPPQD